MAQPMPFSWGLPPRLVANLEEQGRSAAAPVVGLSRRNASIALVDSLWGSKPDSINLIMFETCLGMSCVVFQLLRSFFKHVLFYRHLRMRGTHRSCHAFKRNTAAICESGLWFCSSCKCLYKVHMLQLG